MILNAVIELWDDGIYSIYVSNLKKHNLNAQGKSVEDAKKSLKEALDDYTDMYQNMGKPIPAEINNPTFEYQYDIASLFNYFDWINISKLAQKAGINPSLMSQYKNRLTFASEKQSEKIQNVLHQLGKEMMTAKL